MTIREYAIMRFILIAGLCLAGAFGTAARADAAAGQTAYASRGCIGCHGSGGVSVVAEYPSLKGKSADYIRQSLSEFRSGARQSAVMNAMAAGLSDREIYNLGSYIGGL